MGWVDELGSGVLNVNKFVKEYGGKGFPSFIEGSTFKISIPIPYEGLNEGLKTLYGVIVLQPGIKAKEISEVLNNRPLKTIERQIKELTDKKLIQREGSKKTGGYIVTQVIDIGSLK